MTEFYKPKPSDKIRFIQSPPLTPVLKHYTSIYDYQDQKTKVMSIPCKRPLHQCFLCRIFELAWYWENDRIGERVEAD